MFAHMTWVYPESFKLCAHCSLLHTDTHIYQACIPPRHGMQCMHGIVLMVARGKHPSHCTDTVSWSNLTASLRPMVSLCRAPRTCMSLVVHVSSVPSWKVLVLCRASSISLLLMPGPCMMAKPVPSATDCKMSEVCTVMLYLAMVPACARSVISSGKTKI